MSLADIKNKIQADANAEAEQIIENAKAQADEINKETDSRIQEIKDFYKERFNKEKPEILNRREIVAKLDVEKIELGVKQSLIQNAFDEALKSLTSLSKDKYLGFVEALLDQAVETGQEEILLGESEKKITKEWINTYNDKKGKKLVLSKDKLPISGGFVLRNENISTNCSFEMLLNWIREDLEADVVKRLFSA
jgi:V/A-type H+-transporting ATPase subunit E